ncbi:MAG: hypothetical protein JXB85_05475 [Anaerolineales bacterium]|nr:hypothetical protein [Anaerolineales bacterium]
MNLQKVDRKQVRHLASRQAYAQVRPASYMVLLSALDEGWRIVDVELTPAKDQNGYIFIITLNHPAARLLQEMTLPCNTMTENLLHDARQSA